jgi:hypothetical protein
MSTSQHTRNHFPQVLNNFLLVKLLSLARLELDLLASKEIFKKFGQKHFSKEQNDLIRLALCEEFN